MAFTLAEAFVDVSFNNKGITSGFAKIRAAAASTGAAIGTALGPVAALLAGAFAFKQIISAAAEAEVADTRLAQALANSGNEVDANAEKFSRFATSLQRVTTLGDEQIKDLLSMGLNLGVTADQAENMATAAVGLGRALGMDAGDAMKALAKEAQGIPSTLNRSIPALNGVTDTTQRLAIIQQMAANGMREEAAQAQTLSGSWSQLQQTLGDTAEVIGGMMTPALTSLTSGFNGLLIWIQETWAAITDFGIAGSDSLAVVGQSFSALSEMASSALTWIGDMIHQIIFAFLNWDLSLKTVALKAEWAFKAILGSIQYGFFQGWEIAKWFWNNLGDICVTTANYISTVIQNLGDNIVTLFSAAFEAVRTGSFQPFSDMIFKDLTEGFVSTVKELPKKLDFQGFMPDMDKDFAELDKQWEQRAEKWEKSLDKAVVKPREPVVQPIKVLPAGVQRDAEKADKEAEKQSSLSNSGSFGGLVDAWRQMQSGLIKGEDKQRQEALALAKKQLAAEERIANAVERGGLVAVAG